MSPGGAGAVVGTATINSETKKGWASLVVRSRPELATAMECRCYHGGEGRTALHVLRYKPADWLTLAGFVALAAGVIVLGKFGL